MVKKIFTMLIAAIVTIGVSAQTVDEVTLIVSGDGTTKEEARLSALRDAIGQAYGTFVSANMSILDDEVIKDEIVTVSSGNIREYKELSTVQLPNGNTLITLQATVSVSKLITYARNKGSECEFAGQTFAMNLKLDKLNRENAEKAVDHLIGQLKPLIPDMFEFQLKVEEPALDNEMVRIGCKVYFNRSPKVKMVFDILFKTLDAITQNLNKSPRVSGSNPYINFIIAGRNNYGIIHPSTVLESLDSRDSYKYIGYKSCYKQYLLPSAKKIRIFLTREITGALFNWRIRDNLGATYEVEYNGNYYYHSYFVMHDSYDKEITKESIGNLVTTSTIAKLKDWYDYNHLPVCQGFSRPYSVVSFPFYDTITGNVAENIFNDSKSLRYIYRFLLYIPANQIDKFTSFTIEHK